MYNLIGYSCHLAFFTKALIFTVDIWAAVSVSHLVHSSFPSFKRSISNLFLLKHKSYAEDSLPSLESTMAPFPIDSSHGLESLAHLFNRLIEWLSQPREFRPDPRSIEC